MSKEYYIYIMTNKSKKVLYTGVTSDLVRRVYEHVQGIGSTFTTKYNLTRLVYYEVADDIQSAIAREKQIKAGSRAKKIKLVAEFNPEWKDLAGEI